MFEVGKKYNLKSQVERLPYKDRFVYECFGACGKFGLLLCLQDGDPVPFRSSWDNQWIEIGPEPKVIVQDAYVRIAKGSSEEIYTGTAYPSPDNIWVKTIGKVRFTYTEGEKIKVEVIE